MTLKQEVTARVNIAQAVALQERVADVLDGEPLEEVIYALTIRLAAEIYGRPVEDTVQLLRRMVALCDKFSSLEAVASAAAEGAADEPTRSTARGN